MIFFFVCFFFQNSSKSRLRNLDSLHAFVSAATKELMWLNDKEEEEVNFDWSDRNSNMTAKKDNYSVCFWTSTHPCVCIKSHDFAPKIVINRSIWIV